MVRMILPPPRISPGLVMTAISTMLRPAASAAQGVAVSGGQVRAGGLNLAKGIVEISSRHPASEASCAFVQESVLQSVER